jgi:hypothetical protein
MRLAEKLDWKGFISELVRSLWSASRSERLTPGERVLGILWVGGCVDQRTLLDISEKRKNSPLSIIKPEFLVAQAVAQSLYWLSFSYTKHIQLLMSIFSIMQYDCLKANRESLGSVCPIPLPGGHSDLQKSLRRSICFIIFPYFCQFWPSPSAYCSSSGRKM